MEMEMENAKELKYEVRGVKLFSDGTVDRSLYQSELLTTPPTPSIATAGAFSKDVPIDSTTGTWCRIFLPEAAVVLKGGAASGDGGATSSRLPIILYFHGGGFVLNTAASTTYHEYGCKVAAKMEAIVVSVEYRLAPEHRLPAAFDDGFAALSWLHAQGSDGGGDPWLRSHADLSKCVLMGHSAGATIAYHVALRTATAGSDHHHLRHMVRGIVLGVPYFGGAERTNSEIKYAESDEIVTMEMSDMAWAMALPSEADGKRTHPYCSVAPLEDPELLRTIHWPPSLVVVGATDPLYDRQIEWVEYIRSKGHGVCLKEYGNYGHLLLFPEVNREEDVEEAYTILHQFLLKCFSDGDNTQFRV